MRWTCSNCGKTMDISTEQLAASEGAVVCPQCLATDSVPGYKPRRAARAAAPASGGAPGTGEAHAPTPPRRKATPPPHRKTQNNVNRQPSTTQQQPSQQPPRPRTTRRKAKKKKTATTWYAPASAMGCLWRSALLTAALLALYTAIGYLIS